MPFCGECGAKHAGLKFCGECGAKLAQATSPSPAPAAAAPAPAVKSTVVPTHVSAGSSGSGSSQNKMFSAVTGKGGDPTKVALGLDAQVIMKAGTLTPKCTVAFTEGLERLIRGTYTLKLGTSVTNASMKLWGMHLTMPDDKVTIRSIYRVMCDMEVAEKFIQYESDLKGKVGSYEYKGYQVMYWIPTTDTVLEDTLAKGFTYSGVKKITMYPCPMRAIVDAGTNSLNKILSCKVVLYARDYNQINNKFIFTEDRGLLPESLITYELPKPELVK